MLQYLINRVCGSPAAKQADAIDNDGNGKDVQTPQQLQDELAQSWHDDFPDCLAEFDIRVDTIETVGTVEFLPRSLLF